MTENNKSSSFLAGKKEIQKLFQTVKEASLEEIKKIFTEHALTLENNQEKAIASILNDYKEGKGKTVMHFAAARGDLAIFKYLVEAGGDYKQPDDSKNSCLMVACHHKSSEIVKYLIEERGCDVNSPREGGATPLHISSSEGDLDTVKYLLVKGAKVDMPSIYGSPLEWAVTNKRKKVAQYLLDQGANPNGVPDEKKMTPPPLIMAISSGEDAFFDMLLTKNADVNIKDKEGWSALQFCAEIGDLAKCKILIEKGADPNYICKGKTALDWAYENNKWECVSFLRPLTTAASSFSHEGNKVSNELLEKEEVTDPEASDKLKEEGNLLFNSGKFEEALVFYEKAIRLNRKSAPLHTNKAACLIKLGSFHEALEASKNAKTVNPKWIKAYLREAQAYMGLKEFGDAAASYFDALKLEPSNGDIKFCFDDAVKKGKAHYQSQQKSQ